MATYEEDYARSLNDPEGFWGDAAEGISWYKKWDRVLDNDNSPFTKWFSGAELNTCYNCLDRHVEDGRGDQDALIYDSPMTGKVKKFTYRELTELVARFAGGLQNLGITKGDRVLSICQWFQRPRLQCWRARALVLFTLLYSADLQRPSWRRE